jgi:2-C-methyl-D-erythritol 2,4-cyclodiphosphate synthase
MTVVGDSQWQWEQAVPGPIIFRHTHLGAEEFIMAKRRRLGSGGEDAGGGGGSAKPRRNAPGRLKRPVVSPTRRKKPPAGTKKLAPAAEASAIAQGAEKTVEESLSITAVAPFRVGHGWDLHRLDRAQPHGRGKAVMIGGVNFGLISQAGGDEMGVVAHSDGDVLLHAVTDAILGALGLPDIGQLFPDNDPAEAGRDSSVYVIEAVRKAREGGYVIGNLDCTVICQWPKIGPVKEQMRLNLARLLETTPDRVNLKGKTHEGVDAVGELRALEAHAVVLLVSVENPAAS